MVASNHYSEAFKQEVCGLYLTGNYTKAELSRQFGIGGKCTISGWLLKFENNHLPPPTILAKSKSDNQDASDARELALFKTKLAEAELKVEAYER
ncbi:MAG: transposase-like protein [Flavobacteriales bacterium]|jgi:transposase-like protein